MARRTVTALAVAMAKIADLEERLRQNSGNSSRPPSSDPPSLKRKPKKPRSGRKPGGQPGHEAHFRPLVPVEQVDHVTPVHPKSCTNCGSKHLVDSGSIPDRHQVTELPEVKAKVTETQLFSDICLDCGATVRAELPSGVPAGCFGPRLQAFVATCRGVYHLSVRAIIALMRDTYGVEMSEGSVIACQDAASNAVQAPVAEAYAYVQAQPVANADETSWPQGNRRKGWLWVAVTPLVTVFLIHLRRGAVAAKALLAEFNGILTTDRWKGYLDWALNTRQLCWAHLKRDFAKIAERQGISRRIGKALIKEEKLLFRWWHKLHRGEISRSTFQRYVSPLRERVRDLLSQGTEARNKKTAGTCRDLLKLFPAMWTFVYVEGVEPTNNAAERALRPAVLWRKNSFGTQSEAGSRFVERILTVAETLRQQGRNVLQYMTAAIQAALDGTTAPSLLPSVGMEAHAKIRA